MIRVLVEAPRWLLLKGPAFCAMGIWSNEALGNSATEHSVGADHEFVVAGMPPPQTQAAFVNAALASALGLLAQGWWMVINAKSIFDPQLMALFPTKPLVEALPGSADGLLSSVTILLTTGLLGVLLFTSDLAQNAVWRRRIWLTMALAGVSMCIFGIVQKIGGPPVLGWVWEESKQDANNNFGMFRYRGNAGAFLNLCLPLVAGLAFRVFQRRQNGWARVFWLSSLLLVLAGVQLNASRLSWLIAILIMSAFGVQVAWHLWKQLDGKLSFRRVAVYALVILFALGALFSISSFGRWATSWAHFKSLAMDPSERSPVEIYIHMVPEAGWLGFGPGTFQVVFPGISIAITLGKGRRRNSGLRTSGRTHTRIISKSSSSGGMSERHSGEY